MRKIKFRAWDKQTRDMLEFFAPSMEFYNKRLNRYRDFFDRHIIQMQFTGLHDRNGREIYEGDILRDNDCFLWEVYWEDGAFLVKGGEFDEIALLGDLAPHWCEIVGNIYENPEWLEANGNEQS